MVGHLGQLVGEALQILVGLETVELRNALDADFGEAREVVLRQRAAQHDTGVIGLGFLAFNAHEFAQAFFNRFEDFGPGFAFLNLAVNAIFDENLLQRGVVPLLPQLLLPDFEFTLQQPHGGFSALAQHIFHAHKAGLVIDNDASVGRDADFTIGEGVQCIHCEVGAHAGGQLHLNLHVGGRVVDHLLNLDFIGLTRLHNALHQRRGSRAVRNVADDEQGFVNLLDGGA